MPKISVIYKRGEENMKTVLVTGSSRGLGASVIEYFASKGYNTIINYYSSKRCAEDLKEYIENTYKVKAYVYKCDVSKEDEVKDLFNKIKNDIGNIDCLVNNAGISKDNSLDDKTSKELMEVIENNLLSTFLKCKYVKLIMDKGSIINVASNNIYNGSYIESIDYDASKAGIVSLTHNFAKVYAPNIRVNSVAPGWIDTDMTSNIDSTFKNEETSKILLRRFACKEEIADAIYFLASNSYINNTILKIDGGLK